jgi:carboxypeptidase Q
MRFTWILCLALAGLSACNNEKANDADVVKDIFSEALSDTTAYSNLKTLCTRYEGRICGTAEADGAVRWAEALLSSMGLDTVYLQPMMVPKWNRGEEEVGKVLSAALGDHLLSVCALGWAVGTGPEGVTAEVVEVTSKDQLEKLGDAGIRGKIVFYNQPMDPTHYYTFESYGEAVWQRARGASMAARYGAVAVINRSLTMASDDYPHTGIMHYADTLPKIPALAVSTVGADSLSGWLKKDPAIKLFLRTTSQDHGEVTSYNVIGEIRGSEKPDEIIAFGGHIDAWDNTQGAHDDGVGVIQTIEVLRIFKKLGIRPKHTIRVVVFMDEEVAQRGGAAYAASVKAKNEKHLAAIESDRGGFTPYGFSIDASPMTVGKINNWKKLLEPYGIWSFKKGGSGVDIRDLQPMNIPLLALVSDSQRYFDYQHSPSDTWDKVYPREMQLGSAAITSIVFLIDNYGLE